MNYITILNFILFLLQFVILFSQECHYSLFFGVFKKNLLISFEKVKKKGEQRKM